MSSKLRHIKQQPTLTQREIDWLINQSERASELFEIVMLKDKEYVRVLHESNKLKKLLGGIINE